MMIDYKEFASTYAANVGGLVLRNAMLRQLSGEDQDVAEINWQVQRAQEDSPIEVFANVQADFDRSRLVMSIDERDTSVEGADFETTLHETVSFAEQKIEIGDEVSVLSADTVEGALARFVLATRGVTPFEDLPG
jgi:hypothetical protein